jgi:hypothetical protein
MCSTARPLDADAPPLRSDVAAILVAQGDSVNISRWKIVLLMPLLALLMAATPLLVDPPPISVPTGLNEQAVAKAVTLGVAQRGWIVSKREAGYIEATLNIRTHMARVGITYDLETVQIRYLESSNLDYEVKGDGRHIHRNYLKWVNNMVRDISMQLLTASAAAPAT